MKILSPFSIIAVIAILLCAILATTLIHRSELKNSAASSIQPVTVMYHCPMHPEIIRDHPGTCPICGMTLVPMQNHDNHDPQSPLPSEAVKIDATTIQNIGVTVISLHESELRKTLRVNASIAIDPQNVAVVNARTMGWIETIQVGSEGLRVHAGQQLASFYSPDLVAAQEDYLQALQINNPALEKSARSRLQVLGISSTLMENIQTRGTPMRMVPLLSPITGIVLNKYIVQGQNVMPGVDLYRIADLSRVWAVGTVYPEDLSTIHSGMPVQVFLQGRENEPIEGRILYIAPVVDLETKTTEIRVGIKNTTDLSYKPGMNASIEVFISLGTGIAVPSQSVIRTGERTIVIVALGKGYFAPREVVLGASLGDSVQIREGLAPGDSLVTSAQFLIDSESNLQKALQAFGTKGDSHAIQNH